MSSEEKSRQIMEFKVAEICKEIGDEIGVLFSKEAMLSISHLTLRQCAVIGEDLESFAKHAKRKQVNADDVLLYARKSADLQRHLRRQTDTKK